jgi:sodium-dependent dicarboxylate transporter 2/3/5
MSEATVSGGALEGTGKVLLVDDEEHFRSAMKKQLEVRGYSVLDVGTGEEAIKIVRHKSPEVIVLDQKMPGMDGIQTLKEIKAIRPEVQIIMLTGHGTTEKARLTGKYDVFKYMAKPCPVEELIDYIEAARQERIYAMARHEIPDVKRTNFKTWLKGVHGLRPGIIIANVLLFLLIALTPPPKSMVSLVGMQKSETSTRIMGYSDLSKMKDGQSIGTYYLDKSKILEHKGGAEITPDQAAYLTARKAKIMIGILIMSAIFWASGALPVGITAFLACVMLYMFNILTPNDIARAHFKDAVLFVMGVLGLASAISKTGLDRRIGLLLLSTSKNLPLFLFIFAPLLAVSASFLSEHALVAFVVPVLMLGYMGVTRAAGVKQDKALAVMLLLVCCFAANVGGPGSPAAGGRNAVMIGILADYGIQVSFGTWVKYGLPFVPVCALVIAGYFYLAFRNKLKVKNLDLISEIRKETQKIGKMTKQEYITAVILVILIFMLITLGEDFGMGGPFLFALVILAVFGILQWKDINHIHWDVVALYASASALGYCVALTGGSLWIAEKFITTLPPYFQSGAGLAMSSSLFTGLLTNFMSDGATVAAIGPITVPMAMISNTSPVMVGLATAFASSFAHMMIIGTPNNAIAYAMARDPETGEQLVTLGDFFKHGAVVLILCWIVLFFWTILGYWQWMGFDK